MPSWFPINGWLDRPLPKWFVPSALALAGAMWLLGWMSCASLFVGAC
jgi:hypothetical protein